MGKLGVTMNSLLREINQERMKRNLPPLEDITAHPRPVSRLSPGEIEEEILRRTRRKLAATYGPAAQDFAALEAQLLLAGGRIINKIIEPSEDQWIGVNVLERDDKLDQLRSDR